MNKAKLCNIIRSHYPKAFGIRKFLQKQKVERVKGAILTPSEISECENNAARKEVVIAPYLTRFEKKLTPIYKEMDYILANAPAYQNEENIEELRTDMLFCRLAYGFLPSEYVGFGLEKKTPAERREYMSDLDTYEFGYTVNDITLLQNIVDKGKSVNLFSEYFGRKTLVIEKDKDFPQFQEFIKDLQEFVQKRTNSAMGRNIELVDVASISGKEKEYFSKLIAIEKHLLEEKVIQHEDMAQLNKSSVNTIRCMTFYGKNEIMIPYCFLKAGRNGSFVDNAGAGGIVVGIDPKTGICGTDGFTEFGEKFTEHPETGVVFKGFNIPHWDAMTSLCKSIAEKYPDVRYLSFDMAYTDKGWLVIEVNGIGQLIIPQIVWGRGIKAEIQKYTSKMDTAI